MRSLIIHRLLFILLVIVAYLGSLQWEQYRSEAVIQQLITGALETSEYDIQWLNSGKNENDLNKLLQGSQIIGSEAEIFYGQLYFLQSPSGHKVVAAVYPGLFWPTSITFRMADF